MDIIAAAYSDEDHESEILNSSEEPMKKKLRVDYSAEGTSSDSGLVNLAEIGTAAGGPEDLKSHLGEIASSVGLDLLQPAYCQVELDEDFLSPFQDNGDFNPTADVESSLGDLSCSLSEYQPGVKELSAGIPGNEVKTTTTENLPEKHKRTQWRCQYLAMIAKEIRRKRTLSSITALRGHISENGMSHYLCVMRKSCRSIWKSEENICSNELSRLLVVHGQPKPWFVCLHGWKRPMKRTTNDYFDDCPTCHPQQVLEDTDDEDGEEEDSDDDDDAEMPDLSNYPKCMSKAMSLLNKAVVILNKFVSIDPVEQMEESGPTFEVEQLVMDYEVGKGNPKRANEPVISASDETLDRFDSTKVEQNESGVSAPDEASDHFDSTPVEHTESGVLTSAERINRFGFEYEYAEHDSSVQICETDSSGIPNLVNIDLSKTHESINKISKTGKSMAKCQYCPQYSGPE